jgi:2-iminobutanoate/2-iminopropanoate deaminase
MYQNALASLPSRRPGRPNFAVLAVPEECGKNASGQATTFFPRLQKERVVPKTRIYSPAVAEAPPGRWSNAIRAGDFLFISGQVSRSLDGNTIEGNGEYEQAKIIFTKIRNLVEAAGGTTDDVVKVTIYVVDITQNKEVWRARQEFFAGDFPASTLVEVSALGSPEVLVEIEAVAHLGGK